ncbi:MAG: hypothetical protein WAO20_04820 [Acidobacteriota bacterium]
MKTPHSTKQSYAALAAALILLLASACAPTGTSADSAKQNSGSADRTSLASEVTGLFSPRTYEVPAGTKITVRLDHGLSSEGSESGDEFQATLDTPIVADGRTLVPAGAPVTGLVQHVKEAGKVKGKAEMTLALNSVEVGDRDYPLQVHPLTLQAGGTEGKDAATIAGGAALGAIIGAITGGGKGAAVGAGVGGGAGTGYVLLTKGKEIELSRETRVQFTLQRAAELPEARG